MSDQPCTLNSGAVTELNAQLLDYRYKAIPGALYGHTAQQLIERGTTLSDFQTPLLTLSAADMAHNSKTMMAWCNEQGILLAPHGKTTMAPQLWQTQIDDGAWGVTLANTSQLRVAHAFGVSRVMIANSLTDPQAITWLAGVQSDSFRVTSWVDSLQTVSLISSVIAGSDHPDTVFDLIVDLGGYGGRTGVRDIAGALAIAHAIASDPRLRLVGVGGYEGAFAHTATSADLATVRDYLEKIKSLHNQLLVGGLYAPGCDLMVTAGGSAYFDDVVDVLRDCIRPGGDGEQRVDLIIRSGAYLIHDDGFYRRISPFSRPVLSRGTSESLRPAMHAWARVVSVPEPGLAILDCGKRDVPFDEGLPEPQYLYETLGGEGVALDSATITATNDQHSFLSFDPVQLDIKIGHVVRLGLSHPCTAFDKWTLIPVLTDTSANPPVVDFIHTLF